MLSERLRELRRLSGMTQTELAKRLAVSPSAVGMYEQGRREPNNKILSQLCQIFGVSSDFLLGASSPPDHKDLNTIVEAMREAILKQDGLMFNGEMVNPEDSEKIIDAIKLGISFVMRQKK